MSRNRVLFLIALVAALAAIQPSMCQAKPPDLPLDPGVQCPDATDTPRPDNICPIQPQIINPIRVPGSQQVLLKVRVVELNRTALRQIGMDFLVANSNLKIVSQIGGATVTANGSSAAGFMQGIVNTAIGSSTPHFGVFERGDFALFFSAMRKNSLIKVLAEPNLVALNGHQATFLAGGEFPVPVPQTGGGTAPTNKVQFVEFGVRLAFTPTILDGDVIRLAVDSEVSRIDFSIGTTLVPGGSVVPGLDTRKAHTVVELKEGQSLAMAGLMQVSLDAQTTRIPGIDDLPILGPFFSNTTNTRQEKELIVLVTPYRIESMAENQISPGICPGICPDQRTQRDDEEIDRGVRPAYWLEAPLSGAIRLAGALFPTVPVKIDAERLNKWLSEALRQQPRGDMNRTPRPVTEEPSRLEESVPREETDPRYLEMLRGTEPLAVPPVVPLWEEVRGSRRAIDRVDSSLEIILYVDVPTRNLVIRDVDNR